MAHSISEPKEPKRYSDLKLYVNKEIEVEREQRKEQRKKADAAQEKVLGSQELMSEEVFKSMILLPISISTLTLKGISL